MSDIQNSSPLVIAVVGPTCTGKTSLSLELAKKLEGEIIACDSRTVYKHMNIGTAKPTMAEQALVRHHLLDVLPPNRFYSVAEYKEQACAAIDGIINANRVPIICGGTGLYARALLEGIDIPSVPPQPKLRQDLISLADQCGNTHIHDMLKEVDPASASRLNVNDRVRIIRALEVSKTAGKPFSKLAVKGPLPYKTIWIGLYVKDKNQQKKMISQRLNDQFACGLEQEVLNLLNEPEFHTVLVNAINYKEFIPYKAGQIKLEQVKEQCLLHNTQLARKQITWFKTNKLINWFAVDEMPFENIVDSGLDGYWRRQNLKDAK